ncbi:MAG: hypothetical protein ABIA04_06395 [Pseudomonadota bacterium]
MKILIIIISLLISSFVFSKTIENPDLSEAIIHYKINGNETGTQTIYISDTSRRIERKTQIRKEKATFESHTLQIITDEYIWYIDIIGKTGIKQDNPKKFIDPLLKDFDEEKKKKIRANLERFGFLLAEDMGHKISTLSDKDFLTKKYKTEEKKADLNENDIMLSCSGYEVEQVKTYVFKGSQNIPCFAHDKSKNLLTELGSIDLKPGLKISKKLFSPPADLSKNINTDKQFEEIAKRVAEKMVYMASRDNESKELIEKKQ